MARWAGSKADWRRRTRITGKPGKRIERRFLRQGKARRIHHYDRLIEEFKRKHSRLAKLME